MVDESSTRSKRDRRAAARQRAAELRLAERRRHRRRRVIIWSSVGAALVVAVVVIAVVASTLIAPGSSSALTTSGTLTGTAGPEGIAIESGTLLAADTTSSIGATKDGISCNTGEGSVEHIHTHLTVFVDGTIRPIPAGIGVVAPSIQNPGTADAFAQATKCYYWLHVHANDGIIHVEAPTKSTYTLGEFFAVWGQPLTRTTVAGAEGRQTVYVNVNGKITTSDPSTIPLASREDIQIDIGKPVPYQKVDWSKSQL